MASILILNIIKAFQCCRPVLFHMKIIVILRNLIFIICNGCHHCFVAKCNDNFHLYNSISITQSHRLMLYLLLELRL